MAKASQRFALLLLATVLAATLAGCGAVSIQPGQAPVGPPSWPTTLIQDSRESTTAPEEFKALPEVPSCGEIVLRQGEKLQSEGPLACMAQAVLTGAEIALANPTTEGDPMITFFRVGPGIDGIRVFTDGTHDRYGDRTWSVKSCADFTVDTEQMCTFPLG